MMRAAMLLAAAVARDGAFDGACPNASYALPARRAPVPPRHAAGAFVEALGALARNATALEVGGPTMNLQGPDPRAN